MKGPVCFLDSESHWLNGMKKWENVVIVDKVIEYKQSEFKFIFLPYVQPQRFEEALTWFHYMFNPTGALPGNGVQKYWVTKPFYLNQATDYVIQRIDTLMYAISDPLHPNVPAGASADPAIRDLEIITKFTLSLIVKYEKDKTQLSANLALYKKLGKMDDYSAALSDWSRVHLFLFDLKDSLCRIGIDIE